MSADPVFVSTDYDYPFTSRGQFMTAALSDSDTLQQIVDAQQHFLRTSENERAELRRRWQEEDAVREAVSFQLPTSWVRNSAIVSFDDKTFVGAVCGHLQQLTREQILQWHQLVFHAPSDCCSNPSPSALRSERQVEYAWTMIDGVEHFFPSPRYISEMLSQLVDKASAVFLSASIRPKELQISDAQWRVAVLHAFAAWFTYQLLCVHPFKDGNGRLSRAVADYLLSIAIPFHVVSETSPQNAAAALGVTISEVRKITQYDTVFTSWDQYTDFVVSANGHNPSGLSQRYLKRTNSRFMQVCEVSKAVVDPVDNLHQR